MDNIDDGGDDIFRYDLQWAELDLIDESAMPVWQAISHATASSNAAVGSRATAAHT